MASFLVTITDEAVALWFPLAGATEWRESESSEVPPREKSNQSQVDNSVSMSPWSLPGRSGRLFLRQRTQVSISSELATAGLLVRSGPGSGPGAAVPVRLSLPKIPLEP